MLMSENLIELVHIHQLYALFETDAVKFYSNTYAF